jgi:hypothetical protein
VDPSSRPAAHRAARVPPGRAGGMIGPHIRRRQGPEVRMYTGYGMNGTIVKPPYSTLTAYDLNTGASSGRCRRAATMRAPSRKARKNTGYISQRTGIVTTSAGLLFHAGGDGKLRVYDSDNGRVCGPATCLPDRAASRDVRSERPPVLRL